MGNILALHEPNCAKRRRMCGSDEDGRRRRRERNKVAATKCRNKKKEEEDEESSIARLEVFKTEPKEYKHYSGGSEMYEVYKYSGPEYANSRNLTYPGGYYDHMCLAL